MIIYLCLLALVSISFAFIDKCKNIKNKRFLFCFLCWIIFSLVAGLRDYSTGTDTPQFVNAYRIYSTLDMKYVNFNQVYEPGFIFYMVTLGKISTSPRFFLVITYLFINFCIFRTIYKYSKNYYLSTIIYLCSCQFLVSMCMLRQFIAICIVLLGLDQLFKKRYFKFFLFICVAFLFHYFSIVYIILILIYKLKKFDGFLKFICFFVFGIIFILLPEIVIFFFKNSSNYSDYIPYLMNKGLLRGTLRFTPMLFVAIAFLLPFFFRKPIKNNEILHFELVMLVLLSLILLSSRMEIFTRVYYYFTPFLLFIPNLCKRKNQYFWYFFAVCCLIFIACLITGKGTYGTVPYS